MSEDVDFHISSSTPFTTTGSIDITNTDHAVVIFDCLKPSVALKQLGYITINGQKAVNNRNCQVKMYNVGAIIMPYASDIKPLTVFSEDNFNGRHFMIKFNPNDLKYFYNNYLIFFISK